MMEVTRLRDLTVEHLGNTANEDDLALFTQACREILASGALGDDADELSAIDFVWNDGKWLPRAQAIVDGSLFDVQDVQDA